MAVSPIVTASAMKIAGGSISPALTVEEELLHKLSELSAL
jgi:hypothetical protein